MRCKFCGNIIEDNSAFCYCCKKNLLPTEQDEIDAIKDKAKKGDANAQNTLGLFYELGHNVNKDITK